MKLVREISKDGTTYREIQESSGIGETINELNQSIGRSLTPIRIKGGFCVSTSWLLFSLIFLVGPDVSPGIFALWMVSLFVRFE